MTQTRIGEYQVMAGNAAARFWRIRPGLDPLLLTVNTIMQVAPNDPSTFNTLTLPPRIGVFDVVVRMSEPVRERSLTDAQSVDLLTDTITGQPPNTAMPIWDDGTGTADNRVANFSFAVRIPQGQQHFEGTLSLRAHNAATGRLKRVDLPIRVGEFHRVGNLFVFFVAAPRTRPGRRYCWTTASVVDFANPGPMPALANADVDVKVMRDNFRSGFRHRNRRVALRTDGAGNAAFRHTSGERTVIALPTRWPLIYTATSPGRLPRAHLVRLERADIDHNENAHAVSEIRSIADGVAGALMARSTILIDPGHAVVYAHPGARRSQEWFVAHKIGTRVREILRNRLSVPKANIFMTRTAGFGLIDPADMNRNNAPERGAQRFLFDVPKRTLRVRQAAGTLVQLSNIALTGDNDQPARITEADRNRLIATNEPTVNAIVARIDAALPAGQRVQPGSVRWHAATANYVCRIERHPVPPGRPQIVDDSRHVPIRTTDRFTLDNAMLNNLAKRTARWTIARELGSGPDKHAATGRPNFTAAARAAMNGQNAADYIQRKIIEELELEEPHAAGAASHANYRNKESMGWHFRARRHYINRKSCDIALTIHENAGALTSAGMAMLVGQSPPANQMRVAKIFMKYADPFDQGLRQGGIVDSNAGQLAAQNTRRGNHVYFELEFMTSTILDNPGVRSADDSRYQYQEMVLNPFIETAARQIVAGIVEFLLDAQSDIDTISYDGSNLPTW